MEPMEENAETKQQQGLETDGKNSGEGVETEQPEALETREDESAGERTESGETVQSDVKVDGAQTSEGKEEALMEMYEESIRRVREGEIVQGKIIQIDKEYVLVDIGYKSEGQVPIEEFIGPDGTIEAAVGDTIDIMVERWEDEDGAVLLSKEKASRIRIWDDVKKAYEEDGEVKGVITSRIKGGLSVDIGIPAFLPGSQVDLRPIRALKVLGNNQALITVTGNVYHIKEQLIVFKNFPTFTIAGDILIDSGTLDDHNDLPIEDGYGGVINVFI